MDKSNITNATARHGHISTDGENINIGDYNIHRKFGDKWSVRGTNYFLPTHWMYLPEPLLKAPNNH